MEQGLVQWSQLPPELATWEPLTALRQQFPHALAWGHAGSKGKGNVSNLNHSDSVEAAPSGSPSGSPTATPARPKRVCRPNPLYNGQTGRLSLLYVLRAREIEGG
jgi:hypothetical protein